MSDDSARVSRNSAPTAIYVWLVPSEEVLEQPGSWRIRKWDIEPFPEANYAVSETESHKWDAEGERCVKCGAKDWMGGPCTPKQGDDKPHAQNAAPQVDGTAVEAQAKQRSTPASAASEDKIKALEEELEWSDRNWATLTQRAERAESALCDLVALCKAQGMKVTMFQCGGTPQELPMERNAERQLDAIAEVIGYPKESWRIAGCDTLSHAVAELQRNYIALRDAAPSATQPTEGYDGIAHDFETMREALDNIASGELGINLAIKHARAALSRINRSDSRSAK